MKISPINNNIFKNKITPTNFKGITFEYDIDRTSIFKYDDDNEEFRQKYKSSNEDKRNIQQHFERLSKHTEEIFIPGMLKILLKDYIPKGLIPTNTDYKELAETIWPEKTKVSIALQRKSTNDNNNNEYDIYYQSNENDDYAYIGKTNNEEFEVMSSNISIKTLNSFNVDVTTGINSILRCPSIPLSGNSYQTSFANFIYELVQKQDGYKKLINDLNNNKKLEIIPKNNISQRKFNKVKTEQEETPTGDKIDSKIRNKMQELVNSLTEEEIKELKRILLQEKQ